ncbi:DUF262 domain-containing protein [Rhizobium mongolense]|uniref:DUF262 domain-containing protein n=1 Tax=Rhizobium mongolense TaxID=57676 RepID=UPI0035569928
MSFRVIQTPAQTLTSWWDDKNELDLEPVYQRKGHIWSQAQKQGLVDSILNGFDIPKLYFADFTLLNSDLNEKRKKYAVIDGKQRLLSIFGFFEGEFTLAKNFFYFDDPSLQLGGLSYDDLMANYPKIGRRFDNYNLTVMSVVTDDEAKISELFVRLNTSKPLVGAEIRNAMVGEVPALIRDLVDHPFWKKTKFNKLRGQDKNAAAKLLLIEHTGTFVDTKKRQLDKLVAEANATDNKLTAASDSEPEDVDEELPVTPDDVAEAALEAEDSSVKRAAVRVLGVLGRMEPLFINDDPVLNQQAQIPVIYWLVRNIEKAQLRFVRPFLVDFERQRVENRAIAAGSAERDAYLLDFELMSRTSNDQGSIGGRYKIIRQRFEQFVQRNLSASNDLNLAYREGADAYRHDPLNGNKLNPYEYTGEGDFEQQKHEQFEIGFSEASEEENQ